MLNILSIPILLCCGGPLITLGLFLIFIAASRGSLELSKFVRD